MRRLFPVLLLVLANPLQALHITGGNISYRCLGDDLYRITLDLYRDCDGASMPGFMPIDVQSTCGTFTEDALLASVTEVSSTCLDELDSTACNGGPLLGLERYRYQVITTLVPCPSLWSISWEQCCRSEALNLNSPGTNSLYLHALVDNGSYPCNSAPVFQQLEEPVLCLGQPATIAATAIDADGDSLSYQFVAALNDGGLPIGYVSSTPQVPMSGITIDPATGIIHVTPVALGGYTIAVRVDQWDPDGYWIGSVTHDIMVVVVPCSNSVPDASSGSVTNVTGAGLQVGPREVSICAGSPLCFDMAIADPDVADTLTLTSNVATSFPGATFSYTGTDPVTATFCWVPPPSWSGAHTLLVEASDGACPIIGSNVFPVSIQVQPKTHAGPDQALCGSLTSAPLQATGGSVFTWSAIGGPPLQVGVNFSCNPCSDPVAEPAATTTYVVTSDLTGCTNTDTITVGVVADFDLEATSSADLVCVGDTVPVQFSATVSPGGPGFSYLWTAVGTLAPELLLSDPAGADPLATPLFSDLYTYLVTATGPDGCMHQDTVLLEAVYCGDPEGGCLAPCACAVDGTPATVGTGAGMNSATSYPAPFGNFYDAARHQLLFRASELSAAGLMPGKLTSMAFHILNIPASATDTYFDFTVKLGCSTWTELDSVNWATDLLTVFYEDTLHITPGWMTLDFHPGFNWDGSSSLIVETCFNNHPHQSYTSNSRTAFTPTTYRSVNVLVADDRPDLCSVDTVPQLGSMNRPDVRFGSCDTRPSVTWLDLYTQGCDTLVFTAQVVGEATHFAWQIPPSWTILGPDTTEVLTVLIPAPPMGDPVTVTPINACWSGTPFSLPVICQVGADRPGNAAPPFALRPVPVGAGERLLVDGLFPQEVLGLLSVDGRSFPARVLPAAGGCQLRTEGLPPGVYVLTTLRGSARFVVQR